jgi:sporulation protein YlmC with PRC-barrel domain
MPFASKRDLKMMNKTIAACLLATTMIAAPAMAQTGSSMQNTAPPASGVMSGPFLTNEQTTGKMWRGSKLMGINIYGFNDEKIGDVSDVLLDQQGNVKAVVIGVGGFLGIGEKDVAMPFDQVQWVNQSGGMASNGANTTAPAATAAPGTVATAPRSTDTTASIVARNDMNRTYPDHGKVSFTKDQIKAAPSYRLER